MKKFEIYRAEREKGLTYQQIADKYGVSKQVVGQACGKYQPSRFRFWNESSCIYPNVRKWLNENKVGCAELIRRLGWVCYSTNYTKVEGWLSGSFYPLKQNIDKLLSVTGLSYEKFFERECESDEV